MRTPFAVSSGSFVAALGACLLVACTPATGGTGSVSNASPQPTSESSPDPRSGGPTPTPTASPTAVPPVVVTSGPRNVNQVALTFDADLATAALDHVRDGSYPAQYNDAVINLLRANRTPATVFVTGLWAQQYPEALRNIASDPLFEIENHSWSHDAWTGTCYGLPQVSDPVEKEQEVTRTADVIQTITGRRPHYFRFPGLCHNQEDVAQVASLGEVPVDVDGETDDAFAQNAPRVAQAILDEVKPGSILLFHLNGPPNAPVTAEIVELLLPELKARGLEPVTLETLLSQQ